MPNQNRATTQMSFAEWLERVADPLQPDGPQALLAVWGHALGALTDRRPGFRPEDLSLDDVQFLMGPLCSELSQQFDIASTDLRDDLSVAVDCFVHYLIDQGRGDSLAVAHRELERHLPGLDDLDRLGYAIESRDGESGALAGLDLVTCFQAVLTTPDARHRQFSSDWDVREFCEHAGLLVDGVPSEEGARLISQDPEERLRAERALTARWIILQATTDGATLEVFMAGLLAAAQGAAVPLDLLLCAARLQATVDDYRLERTGEVYEEELGHQVRSLGEAGISAVGDRLQIAPALSAAVVLAVLTIADTNPVRRDVVVQWVDVLNGSAPWVVEPLEPLAAG